MVSCPFEHLLPVLYFRATPTKCPHAKEQALWKPLGGQVTQTGYAVSPGQLHSEVGPITCSGLCGFQLEGLIPSPLALWVGNHGKEALDPALFPSFQETPFPGPDVFYHKRKPALHLPSLILFSPPPATLSLPLVTPIHRVTWGSPTNKTRFPSVCYSIKWEWVGDLSSHIKGILGIA